MIIIGPNQSINCSFFHTITLTNPTLLFCNFFLIVFLLHPLSSLFFYPLFHLHAFYSSSYSSRFFLLPNCSSLFLISFVPHSTTDQSVGSILLSQSFRTFWSVSSSCSRQFGYLQRREINEQMRKSVLIQVEEMKRGRGRPKITLKVEKMKCQLSRQQKV